MQNSSNKQSAAAKHDDEIDLIKLFYILLRQWPWFVLFGVLGLLGGYGYFRLTKPQYTVNASILVPEKSKGLDMKDLFEGGLMDQQNTKILNQIQIIKSYYLINQTLLKLGWQTSWYRKDLLIWKGIFEKEPFDVQEAPGFVNPRGIRIYITPLSADDYSITVDGEFIQDEQPVPVRFEAKGSYGQPFQNAFFNFTLLKKINDSRILDGKYYFQFNDLNRATLNYRKRLIATQTDVASEIIECSIIGDEPKREVEFLNELINVYIESKMNLQNEAQRRSLEFINTQLSGISDSLSTAGSRFTDFRSKNNIIDLGAEGKLVMDNLKEIETNKAKSQMQLDYFSDLLKYLNDSKDLKQLVSPSVVGIEDVTLNSLVLKLSELYNRRQILGYSAKENNPTLIMLDGEIRQTRKQLSENIQNLIDNATRNINSQKDRQTKITVQLNKLPKKEQQMINIQREFNLTNEIYTFLLQKRAETNIALASSTPDVQVIDIARIETANAKGLSRMVILLIGLMLGLFLPAVVILARNLFNTRISSQEDIENLTTLPMLGNIMHAAGNADFAVFSNPKSNLAESFRDLRTNIEFMLPHEQGKVISIHSTNPGEGKSFTATNLASILAMNEKKVLLIGADMRKPRLHKIFELDNEKGLSTYLIGYHTLEEIVFPTTWENLFVMPAGPIPPNPAEILGKPLMKELITMLRTQYDYIILDNAPVSLITDGIIVSRLSDLNMFILRFGISRKHQLEMINQFAATHKVDHIGLVVNDIKISSIGYSYYKYYEYESYQQSYYEAEEQSEKKKRKKKN